MKTLLDHGAPASRARSGGAALAAVAAAGLLGGAPSPARACGGFFCSASGPVVQNAERIVFVDRGDGRFTAIVQIQYEGPAENFAWIVPVPGVPDVGVSSGTLFQRLDAFTRPRFNLTTTVMGQCDPVMSGPFEIGFVDGGAAGPDAGGTGGVTVLASGAVGPFDFTVLAVDPDASNPAQVALDWLEAFDYDVTQFGPELLGSYLEGGMNLAAFRLRKNRVAGDIRPVTLTYRSARPMIPIRLTAVAATPDMGVLTWVVGPARAVPVNYASLELNLARVDWLRNGSNYLTLVNEAADEAGGQGFVTELAQPLSRLTLNLYAEDPFWNQVKSEDWAGRELALIETVVARIGGWDGMAGVIRETVALPADLEASEFIRCPRCYFDPQQTPVDAGAFIRQVEDVVIEPMRASAAFFDDGFLTRLYTTLSPAEMTLDPIFDFNSVLPEVDNVKRAERVIRCRPGITIDEAPFTVEIDGVVVEGRGFQWPVAAGDSMPANRSVLQHGASGRGTVVTDNTDVIAERLDEIAETLRADDPSDPTDPTDPANPLDESGNSCRCVNHRGGASSAWLGFALLLVGSLARRPARRR